MLEILNDNEESAVAVLPQASQDEKTQRRRLQQIGRVCAAVKTAQFLLAHNLPVPMTMHRWLVTAARRVNRVSSAKALTAGLPVVPQQPAAVMPAVFEPSPTAGAFATTVSAPSHQQMELLFI